MERAKEGEENAEEDGGDGEVGSSPVRRSEKGNGSTAHKCLTSWPQRCASPQTLPIHHSIIP